MKPKYSEFEIKRLALDCQDACNIIAVSILLANATRSLSRLGFDSPGINSHPAVILIVDKLSQLLQYKDWTEYSEAYDHCLTANLGGI